MKKSSEKLPQKNLETFQNETEILIEKYTFPEDV